MQGYMTGRLRSRYGGFHDRDAVAHNVELPRADLFVRELARRVDAAYPSTIISITRIIADASGGSDKLIGFIRNPLTKAGFLVNCAAEEIASISSLIDAANEKVFVREVIQHLGPLAKPLPRKRISPDLRSLLRQFKTDPTRSRVLGVQYMLGLSGLSDIGETIPLNASCELALECTVMTDGIAGILWRQMNEGESQSVPAAELQL